MESEESAAADDTALESDNAEEELLDFDEKAFEEEALQPSETENLDEENLQKEIEEAESALSPEELESELDAEIVDDLDLLDEKSIKEALGEEIEPEETPPTEEEESFDDEEVSSENEVFADADREEEVLEEACEDGGVEALKRLLEVLSDKEIAASLKGRKITINITIGEEKC